MIFDTPGFTSFDILEAEEEELQHLYPEMTGFLGGCRYHNCKHLSEPGCSIRQAVEEGKIHSQRYQNYVSFYEELKEQEKRRY